MYIKINKKERKPFLCEMWNHNHSVELLSFKFIFFAYFEEGMSASKAFHQHETLLMKDPVTHATGWSENLPFSEIC